MLNDLKVFKETYDFSLWIYKIINNFPKSEKYTLGENIKKCLLDIFENIISFCKYDYKKRYLKNIDINLEKLRIFLRFAKDLNILSFRRYDYAEKKLYDIGLLVGGLMKKY
jgi:four helix bundle protein